MENSGFVRVVYQEPAPALNRPGKRERIVTNSLISCVTMKYSNTAISVKPDSSVRIYCDVITKLL